MENCRYAWTRDTITLGTLIVAAASHLPALINPNPLNLSRYVALNSGMTAEDRDYPTDFCLLRRGDFSPLSVKEGMAWVTSCGRGSFDESWNLPKL